MAGIDIGLGSSNILPGTYIKTAFAQGQSIATAGSRNVLYVMPKGSAGTWQANQIVQVKSETDAITGAGTGSPLHRALRMHFRTTKRGKVYALPYAATSGSGVETADGYVEFSGTATSAGQVKVDIAGESMIIGYASGATASAIGDLVEARANGLTHLPCTASNSSGEVTLTANIAGESQNGVIRFRAEVISGTGITIEVSGETLGTGAGTPGAEGATTEQANFEAALAVIAQRYYYTGISLNTADALAALQAKLVQDADPLVGNRQVAVAGTVEAQSTSRTKAIARNYERLMLVNQPYSEHTPDELVGAVLAVRSYKENVSARAGFSGFRGDSDITWNIKAVYDQSNWTDKSDLNDMLTDGVTPIGSDENGSYIVKAVTTRSKNAAGTVDDKRALEPHRVSVVDFYGDTLSLRHNNMYVGQDYALQDDTYEADGVTVNSTAQIPPKTVTPSIWRGLPKRLIDEFGTSGMIKNAQGSKDSLEVQISGTNPARLEAGVNLEVTDLFDQVTILINETSAG